MAARTRKLTIVPDAPDPSATQRGAGPPPALTAPEWMGDVARAEYDRVVAWLGARGWLASTDGALVEAYAQTYARWVEAEEFLAQHGTYYVTRDKSGAITSMKPVPQVAIAQTATRLLKMYAAELRITPLARDRAGVSGDGPADPDW